MRGYIAPPFHSAFIEQRPNKKDKAGPKVNTADQRPGHGNSPKMLISGIPINWYLDSFCH
jgi:hypothetical protein